MAVKVANATMLEAGAGLGGPDLEMAVTARGLLPEPSQAYRNRDGRWLQMPFDKDTGVLTDPETGELLPGVVPDAIVMEYVGGPHVHSMKEAAANLDSKLEELTEQLYADLAAKGLTFWDTPLRGNVVVEWKEDVPRFRVLDLNAVAPIGVVPELPLDNFVFQIRHGHVPED